MVICDDRQLCGVKILCQLIERIMKEVKNRKGCERKKDKVF